MGGARYCLLFRAPDGQLLGVYFAGSRGTCAAVALTSSHTFHVPGVEYTAIIGLEPSQHTAITGRCASVPFRSAIQRTPSAACSLHLSPAARTATAALAHRRCQFSAGRPNTTTVRLSSISRYIGLAPIAAKYPALKHGGSMAPPRHRLTRYIQYRAIGAIPGNSLVRLPCLWKP